MRWKNLLINCAVSQLWVGFHFELPSKRMALKTAACRRLFELLCGFAGDRHKADRLIIDFASAQCHMKRKSHDFSTVFYLASLLYCSRFMIAGMLLLHTISILKNAGCFTSFKAQEKNFSFSANTAFEAYKHFNFFAIYSRFLVFLQTGREKLYLIAWFCCMCICKTTNKGHSSAPERKLLKHIFLV